MGMPADRVPGGGNRPTRHGSSVRCCPGGQAAHANGHETASIVKPLEGMRKKWNRSFPPSDWTGYMKRGSRSRLESNLIEHPNE
jgi:hypothetical protein